VTRLPAISDHDAFTRTRAGWHGLAEHVLSRARHDAEGRIRLQVVPGGFGTPEFVHDGTRTEIRVVGRELLVMRGGQRFVHPITTIGAAAEAVGIEPGAPTDVYTPTTELDVDAPLVLDDGAIAVLAAWFEVTASALEDLVRAFPNDSPSECTLWPEHFDLAIELGDEGAGTRCTFGASPDDEHHHEPYLYVTHWAEVVDDPYWNDTTFAGASLDYDELRAAGDARAAAVDFFRRGRDVLSRS
jgi:hypothetical protein